MQSYLPLALGLVMFSFIITSALVVPFINFLYKVHLTRRKEAPSKGKVPLFDKLHDRKAGTPVGGGVLIIFIVSLLFAITFPIAIKLGVRQYLAHRLSTELFIIFFTFISFGCLGLLDDIVKTFGKPKKGVLGFAFGLNRRLKFLLQWILAGIVSFLIFKNLGVSILNIPMTGIVLNLGWWFVPFSAFVIVSFTNAFNITDGLDGLSTGLLMICLTVFGVIAAGSLDTPLAIFIALWVGALLAFLYFNIWPARIWLGDSGALSFGATLAVVGLLMGNVIALVVVGGVFVVEIASSAMQILGWKILKKPILPLAPLHNTLFARGWEEPKIVMRAWLAGIIFGIFGLWLATI